MPRPGPTAAVAEQVEHFAPLAPEARAQGPFDRRGPWSETELRDLVAVALRLALYWSRSRQDAEDIAQEAMLRLVLHQQVGRPCAWLAVVVRRLAWRLKRERLREGAALAVERRRPRLDRATTAQESRCTVAAALGRATPHDRHLLLLDAVGFSDEEIGRRLGCRTRSVHTLLSRARGRLRRGAGTSVRSPMA